MRHWKYLSFLCYSKIRAIARLNIRKFHVPVCIQNLCIFAAVLKGVPSEAEIRPVEPDADNAAVGR